jgi:hypothetical protein
MGLDGTQADGGDWATMDHSPDPALTTHLTSSLAGVLPALE